MAIGKKEVHFYAEVPDFRVRLILLALAFLLILPLSEWLFAEKLSFYSNNWTIISVVGGLNLLFLIFIQLRFGSKKHWAYIFTVISLIFEALWVFRIVNSEFNPLLALELTLLIIAFSFVFDRRFFVVFYLLGATFILAVSLFYVSEWNAHVAIFILGYTSALLFFVYSFYVKVQRLSILEFSEGVLSHYDKFVIVYNQFGNVTYINDYAANRFQFDKKNFKFEDWWESRNYSVEETHTFKTMIAASIRENKKLSDRLSVENMPNGEEITIEWQDQIIRQKYYIGIGSDVTLNLKNNLESDRLSKVTKALQAGVATYTADGVITWCNISYAEIFGFSVEEIIGSRPSQLFKVPAWFEDKYKSILETGIRAGYPSEIAHYTKDGRIIWILLNTSQIIDDSGLFVEGIDVVTDITAQKEREFQFKQTSLIVERTQTLVIIVDNNFSINWFNEAVLTEFEFSFDDIIGKNFISRFLKIDEQQVIENHIISAINLHASSQLDIQLLRNQLSQWYKISIDPIVDENRTTSQCMIVMHNIQELKNQQLIIEHKNKDILDSISYAKRIQAAFLPDKMELKKQMPEHFFYFRPKDIVSGDFYFVKKKGHHLFIAVADCTGHGVPGAMITSIAAAALNNAIFDFGLVAPAEILEHADSYLKLALSANSQEITDGMDLGFLTFNFEKNTLSFSGARRPLILTRNKELEIINGIKRSIGEFADDELMPFTQQEFSVDHEFNIYLFTDGIPDQFGGERHKKIGLRRFLNFIKEHDTLHADELLTEFELQINKWTDDFNIIQTDDMLFFGAKINPTYMLDMKTS